MCYSAAASFELGSLLVPMGLLSSVVAYRKNKHFVFFALIPLFFGLQQLVEGFIWLRLEAGDKAIAHFYGYFYLFFAFGFWPFYIPISAYSLEPLARRRKWLQPFLYLGVLLSAFLYVPILLKLANFTVRSSHQSVIYDVYDNSFLLWPAIMAYAVVVIFPFLISSEIRVKIYGILVLIALVISSWWHFYALTSVWCFFAALLSIYTLFTMYRLPRFKKISSS